MLKKHYNSALITYYHAIQSRGSEAKLLSNISEKEFQFLTKNYLFVVKTFYRPATSKAAESKQITLINIIDPVEKEAKIKKLKD